MKAYYDLKPDCKTCVDSAWSDNFKCSDCLNALRSEVVVLAIGVGRHGTQAIVQTENGKLKSVSIDNLTIIEEEIFAGENIFNPENFILGRFT